MGLLGHGGLLSKAYDATVGQLTGQTSAKKANEQNIALQRETNAQSIGLANSAHQREVQDLIAAGLNPVLSAGGSGAVTPSLGTAQVQNTNPGGLINNATQVAQAYGSIMGGLQAMSGAQLQQAQTKQAQVQTELQPVLAKAEVAQKMAGAGSAKAQQAYTEAMTDVDKAYKEAEAESQKWENNMNKELGTSKNENGLYRGFKNAIRSLVDKKYNPTMNHSARSL